MIMRIKIKLQFYWLMTEQFQNQYLNSVIECLQDQENSPSLLKKSPQNINVIYESTKNLLGNFEDHFNRCKKYNEAKIHRKYEIIINDLSEQNKNLKAKIKLELQSRPGSQMYVSDLIDKMIELRNKNEKLSKQHKNLKNIIEKLEEKYEPIHKNNKPNDEQNPENKEILKKEWEKILIRDTTNKFLQLKRQQMATQHNKETSNFEYFLQFNQSKLDRWYLIDLFERIEKWTNNLRDVRFLDKSKIKINLQRSISKPFQPQSTNPQIALNTLSSIQRERVNKSSLEYNHMKTIKFHNRDRNNARKDTFKMPKISRSENKIQAEVVFNI